MISNIRQLLDGKRILLLGYGREGRSSLRMIKKLLPEADVAVADRDDKLCMHHPQLENMLTGIHTGPDYLKHCEEYDLLIKSPGIPYSKVLEFCPPQKISSQTDLFLKAFWERVIGVTGTKGKSTTVTLIHHLLLSAGHKSVLSGNIGTPPFDMVDEIEDDTTVVFEMSSHQLEHISLAPRVAVLLNIFPEHLDHYEDFTAYRMAKYNIHHMQREGSFLIYNADDPFIAELVDRKKDGITTYPYSAYDAQSVAAFLRDGDIVIRLEGKEQVIRPGGDNDLPGSHNQMNLMAATLACMNIGLNVEEIVSAVSTYKRLEHRLEFAGTFGGVKFYNDSIATIPEASIAALKTLRHVDLLILGGYDRKLDYQVLYTYLQTAAIPNIVFIGEAGKRMHKEVEPLLPGNTSSFYAIDMRMVFEIIKSKLREGDVCLLSPAAASYGMFTDFEERGRVFKDMAAAL